MEYLLSCGCGRKIPVSRSQAGQELSCECGQRLQVPTLRGFADLPVASSETLSTSPRSSIKDATEGQRQAWGGWRGTVMAIAVAIFALSALPCAYYIFLRSQINTSYGIEDEIAAGNEIYDAFPLENLVAEWSNFERSGLGPKDKPAFYIWNMIAREQEILAMITGSVAALSAATAIGMWVSAPKAKKQ